MKKEYIKRLEVRISVMEESVRYLEGIVRHHFLKSSVVVGDKILTVNEVGNLLGLPGHIIYDKAVSGEIPSFKVGNRHKFYREKVLEWFEGGFSKTEDIEEYVDRYLQKNILSG